MKPCFCVELRETIVTHVWVRACSRQEAIALAREKAAENDLYRHAEPEHSTARAYPEDLSEYPCDETHMHDWEEARA